MPRIAIITMVIGADYEKSMEPGLKTKRDYAQKHGYDFHVGGKEVWDRTRPIPWSKFNFILKHLDNYDYLFWSDADVIFLRQDLSLESHILPLLPPNKDLLWSRDACNHTNNGHLLIRGRSQWVREFFKRAYDQTDLIHHIWWDNAAMDRLHQTVPTDMEKMETCNNHWLFNAFIYGPKNTADDTTTRLYKHGDFLVHFAGVYDLWNIYRLMKYVESQANKNLPLDTNLLNLWRSQSPLDKKDADKSLMPYL